MKKCLIVSTVSRQFTLFEKGNIELLKKLGYEVHCAANFDDATEELDKLGIIKHPFGIQRSPFSLKNLKAYRELKKIVKEGNYDLVHCHSPMGGVLTRLATRKLFKKGLRVIYTAHGFHFYKGAPLINWLLYYPIERLLAKYTSTLITINQEDYELAIKKFKKRCNDIYKVNGIGLDSDRFKSNMTNTQKDLFKESLGIKKNSFVLTCVGRLDKNKNQSFLIESIEVLLKKHRDISLLLVGKDELNGTLQKIVEQKGLAEVVHFLGFRDDIPKILEITDIVVSASFREGLPVNIMEALASNKVVVTLQCRGAMDLIIDGKNGFVVKNRKKQEFIEIIDELYENRLALHQMQLETNKTIQPFLKQNVSKAMKTIYSSYYRIAYLRSTAIFNDSRATKEINAYTKANKKVLAFGWNRRKENISFDFDDLCKCYLFELKAEYGGGFKSLFKMVRFNQWLFKRLKDNVNAIDIIHACDFDTALVGYLFAKKYNKKLIYDIYDYYVESHNLHFLKKIIEKMDIKIIDNADYTIICNDKRKEQIAKAHPKEIVVIHNSPRTIPHIRKERMTKEKIRIGYFGILQDHRLLLEISKEVVKNSKIELHIGGFGQYEDYFRNLSISYKNIFFYGVLPYKDVIEKEKKCDLLFATYNPSIPNHKYSAPNKVYEAMALDLPIIVCRNTGVDEMVEKEGIGYVIGYDAKDFIHNALKIKQKRFNDSREIFKKKYSWEIMEQKLILIIDVLRGKNNS